MRRRIFAMLFLLAVVAAATASVVTAMVAHDNYLAQVQRGAAADAAFISAGIELSGLDYLNAAGTPRAYRVTWFAGDGAVLYDSERGAASMGGGADQPEVAAAITGGAGYSERESGAGGARIYYYALSMSDGSVLRVAAAMTDALSPYDTIIFVALVLTPLILIGAAIGSSVLTRGIFAPLLNLDLERGDDPVYDEIAPLVERIRAQRRRIESQTTSLERQRVEFAAITANMNEGFLTLNDSGAVLTHNRAALTLLDSTLTEAAGRHIYGVNRSEGLRLIVEEARTGKAAESTLTIAGRVVLTAAHPVFEAGRQRGMTLILMDVTEQREREMLRREFAANVSHELKTPLTVLAGSAELLMNGLVAPGDTERFGEGMYRESQRMIALVNDLLFLSRLDEGESLAFEDVDLAKLARDVADRVAPKARVRGITVGVIAAGVVIISGARTVLDAMISNLADNAVKYNVDNGGVMIEVRCEGEAALLVVEDTGIGIPKEDRERVFERFYRVDKSRGGAIPGTGLGLAIVKHAAMLHGARVNVSSGVKGTRVEVRFRGNPLCRCGDR